MKAIVFHKPTDVRADVGSRKVPERLSDEQGLFLTDTLPTGWTAIDWAEL